MHAGSLVFLQRNIASCPQDIKAQCYKTLVRPILEYRNDPKFSDRYAWANSANPDQIQEQPDQGRGAV